MDKNYYVPMDLTSDESKEARKFIHAGTLRKGLRPSEIGQALRCRGEHADDQVMQVTWVFKYMNTVVKIAWTEQSAEVHVEPNFMELYDLSYVCENISAHIEESINGYTEKYLKAHYDPLRTEVDDLVWAMIKTGTPVVHIPTGEIRVFKEIHDDNHMVIFETLDRSRVVPKEELTLFDNY